MRVKGSWRATWRLTRHTTPMMMSVCRPHCVNDPGVRVQGSPKPRHCAQRGQKDPRGRVHGPLPAPRRTNHSPLGVRREPPSATNRQGASPRQGAWWRGCVDVTPLCFGQGQTLGILCQRCGQARLQLRLACMGLVEGSAAWRGWHGWPVPGTPPSSCGRLVEGAMHAASLGPCGARGEAAAK